MKVLLVNGSPKEHGCTYTALREIADVLQEQGVTADFFHIGIKPISGCIACRKCVETGLCVFKDSVNVFIEQAANYDGFIFGTPVHYAAMSGGLTSFMDRAFYAPRNGGNTTLYHLKPAAGVVSARRAGATAAFDQLNKYFTISQMPIISSQYWNMVHGNRPEEVKQDLEGLQIMRTLARNMAWFLRCKEAAAAAGIPLPQEEATIHTNFIR